MFYGVQRAWVWSPWLGVANPTTSFFFNGSLLFSLSRKNDWEGVQCTRPIDDSLRDRHNGFRFCSWAWVVVMSAAAGDEDFVVHSVSTPRSATSGMGGSGATVNFAATTDSGVPLIGTTQAGAVVVASATGTRPPLHPPVPSALSSTTTTSQRVRSNSNTKPGGAVPPSILRASSSSSSGGGRRLSRAPSRAGDAVANSTEATFVAMQKETQRLQRLRRECEEWMQYARYDLGVVFVVCD
jgi:hypothetical protein